MNKTGESFDFNGHNSKDFNLIFGSDDGMIDEIPMGLARDVSHSDITKYRLVPNHTGAKYSEVLEFEIELMKDPCKFSSQRELKFTRSEIGEINAWLTSPRFPKLFHVNDFENDIKDDSYVDYFVTFSECSGNAYGDIYSLKYTVTCNAPFGFSSEYTHTLSCSSTTIPTTIIINNTNDEQEEDIFPVFIIEPKQTGRITIENKTQGESISFEAYRDNTVTIDSNKLKISDYTGKLISLEDLGLVDLGSLYWPSLSYGRNEIVLTGNAEMIIKYREIRKVGAY